MREQLRILFLEDSADDAELEERELLKGGVSFASLRVHSRQDFVRALHEWKPALVISDYTLSDLDGRTALEITRETSPGLPFILVSGTIGEARAVACIKDGATDYVTKDQLGSLPSKVRRALKEVEDRVSHAKLELQLRQALKMEAIGRLAGGVAHDFNNLLTVINGYSQMIMARFPEGDLTRADAAEILRAGERASALTRQLLAFSRRQIMAPVVLSVNRIVSETEKMLRRLIGEDVELVTALDPGLGNVKADPGQIEQVLMNLAVNARDAMPNGGRLTLETANVTLDETYVSGHPGARVGHYAMLAVSDTGAGMDPETLSHLYEPFFTTKEQGKGTGLGLSTAYGIVKQSGGTIWAYSEPGMGATFKVYLPIVGDAALPARTAAAVEARGGTETVLVVEDADAVRKITEHLLRRAGYTTLVAASAEEAFRQLGAHAGAVHLLVTDVVLPGVSGPELAHRLRVARPNLKVLYTSGYTDRGVVDNGYLASGVSFLQKPFTAESLTRKVREVLDSRE